MLDSYRRRMAQMGSYEGESRRRHSQQIMDASWMRDAATKPVYVKWVNSGLPIVDDDDIPVYAKFNVKSYHNITGDEVAYLLQFRLEDIKHTPDIKVGSYVYIPNEMDEYEWWLIWHLDDRTQFRQYSILKCTWIYKWTSFKDGHRVIHQCLGVTRNQNNYNSGCWLDYTFEIVEQQHVMMMPSNDDTNILTYNTRMLVSNEGRYPPIAWKISKVQPSVVNDTVRFTMTQEQFDPIRDNDELMIANYFDPIVNPTLPSVEDIPSQIDLEIVYSNSPSVRAGGGYKKFTLKQHVDGELVNFSGNIQWSIDEKSLVIGNQNENKIPFGENDGEILFSYKENTIKVKCTNDYLLIGKTFTLTATTEYGSKSLVVEVTSL